MDELLDPMKNPVTYAAPFFVLTILVELAALKWLDHDDNVTGYALKDARTSISMGVGSLVFLTAVFIFHEPMSMLKLVSFIIIWLALAIFSASAIRDDWKRRKAA